MSRQPLSSSSYAVVLFLLVLGLSSSSTIAGLLNPEGFNSLNPLAAIYQPSDSQQGGKQSSEMLFSNCWSANVPHTVDNAVITSEGSNKDGVVWKKFECRAGHTIIGQPYVICGETAQWFFLGKCQRVCGYEPLVDNAFMFAGENTAGSVRNFTCQHGYNLVGDGNVLCNNDGKWMTHGLCQPSSTATEGSWQSPCGPLFPVKNGHYSHAGQGIWQVVCNPGFSLSNGAEFVSCDENFGMWGIPGTCVDEKCGPLPDVKNGTIELGSFEKGAVRRIRCDPGTALRGPDFTVCTSNGEWTTPGACDQTAGFVCGAPPVVDHGAYQPSEMGAMAMKLVCERDFKISGSVFIYCSQSGQWSGQQGFCTSDSSETPAAFRTTVDVCTMFPTVANGILVASGRISNGSSLATEHLVKCNDGYELAGSPNASCTHLGWAVGGLCVQSKAKPMTIPILLRKPATQRPARRRSTTTRRVEPTTTTTTPTTTTTTTTQSTSTTSTTTTTRRPVLKPDLPMPVNPTNLSNKFEELVPSGHVAMTGDFNFGFDRQKIENHHGPPMTAAATTTTTLKPPMMLVSRQALLVTAEPPTPPPVEVNECCGSYPKVKTPQLIVAVRDGNVIGFNELLWGNADTESRDASRWTPLMWASYNNRSQFVVQLLACCADVEARNKHNSTALMFAARSGNLAAADALLSKGADPNAANIFETTPLLFAAQSGKTVIADLLLIHGANISARDADGNTALHWAVRGNFVHTVRHLLDAGANPNLKNGHDETPLMLAARSGFDDVLHQLLRHNRTDVDERDADGHTALRLAQLHGKSEAVKLLNQRAGSASSHILSARKRSRAEFNR